MSRRGGIGTLGWLTALLLAGGSIAQPTSTPAPSEAADANGGAAVEALPGAGPTVEADARPARGMMLGETVVTASRREQTLFDLPYAAARISDQTLFERSYRTLPQALRNVPGVMVQETAPGHGSPYIRGFTSFRNLFLIDGVRLNNSVFRPGPNQYWNTVDPWSIDRVEVVKGPGSVLYGSDAIGGTVQAFTRNPYTYDGSFDLGGRTIGRYASAEESWIGRAELSVGYQGALGLLVGGTYKDFGTLEGGDDIGEQPNTGYEEYDLDFKAEYFLNDHVRIVALHQRVRQNNVLRTHRTVFAVPFNGTTVGSDLRRDLDQERELTYVQLHAEELDGPVRALRASISHHRQSETRDRVRGSGVRELQGFDVDTVGLWLQLESPSPIGELTYGLEYYHDDVESFSSTNPIQGPVADDATYDLLGVFLQNQIELTPRLDLTLGGRFTFAAADADSVRDPDTGNRIQIEDDWTALVGNARLSYALVPETLRLYGGVAQGFRAPNLSDLTRFDTARTNEFETPAPGLDPEEYLSFEVGAKLQERTVAAEVSYFYTMINDQIVRFPTGNVVAGDAEVTKANIGDGQVFGIEAGAAWDFLPQWTLFGNVTYIEGEVDTFPTSAQVLRSEYLSRLMPLSGQLGLRWEAADELFWAEALVRMADKADKLSTRDQGDTSRIPPGGTPGYAVLHLRGGWNVDEFTRITAAVENVFNKDYRVHGSGHNMPGRNFILAFERRF